MRIQPQHRDDRFRDPESGAQRLMGNPQHPDEQFRVDRLDGPPEVGPADGFVAPPNVDPNDYLSSDPLTYGDDQPLAARVLVDAARSSLVIDALGEDAVVEQRDDGSVVVALAVVNREAFRTFVLDLLDHAEVLEPPELRAELVTWLTALAGDRVGTLFHPTGKRRPTRLLWLAHATEPLGTLALDAGAVRAVTERRASLLAAGVTGVTGSFVAGDPVDLVDPDGVPVARGLVNFDADEIPDLLGRTSHDLKRELGAAYQREVVHRDDLVLL